MAKILIDKLAMPFCQEQLEEFVAAGLSTTQPYLREAIIDSCLLYTSPSPRD